MVGNAPHPHQPNFSLQNDLDTIHAVYCRVFQSRFLLVRVNPNHALTVFNLLYFSPWKETALANHEALNFLSEFRHSADNFHP